MAAHEDAPAGPDLTQGIAAADLADGGMIQGHVGETAVLVARRGHEIFAIGGKCTHYGGPLAEGFLVGDTVRCPWHHACFSLRTGEALAAPAFDAAGRWHVEQRDGRIFVARKLETAAPALRPKGAEHPRRIVIVGGGAAGFAAAEMLRRRGFDGELTMLSDDGAPPCDRPNLSKDYLAGQAPEAWVPLKGPEFYADNRIEIILDTGVDRVDVKERAVVAGGRAFAFDRLLLATGAEPVRLSIPGADKPHVFTLRSLADCRAIIARAQQARRAVVLGASFIGLEVAASLRARGLEVHVVAPDPRPMVKVLGPELGDFVRKLHEEHDVRFHLENTVEKIDGAGVTLKSGDRVEADLVVAGIGVRPRIKLAEEAGLMIDRGVLVDEYLQTSAPGIFAAGDIARWPDPHSGETIRVEHWVVAERQGQTAAVNMLGFGERYTAVPFFWSQHYDVAISYVGHAEKWDAIEIDGNIDGRDCLVRYKRSGKVLAIAAIGRDVEALRCEAAMEQTADTAA
jgi:NADPH-dependent 2,4-dienoyl-CoA reductase/sulfur reductase-like enzyme/nitrite reductase/ring-hydroxylating ferredoxin subunit